MMLGPFLSVFVLFLLLPRCKLGSAVKDLKEKHSISSSSYISSLKPGHGLNEFGAKSFSPSSQIASRKSSFKPSSGVDEDEENMVSIESVSNEVAVLLYPDEEKMTHLDNKYEQGHELDEAEEKMTRIESVSNEVPILLYTDAEKMTNLGDKYRFGQGEDEDEDEEKMTRIESVSNEIPILLYTNEEKMTHLDNKYKSGYGVDEVEEKSYTPASLKMMEHHQHHIENVEHDNDIRSEDVRVFTIDDVLSFHAGKKLSTFFSIRKPDLYPGFLPREIADSIPFSSSETTKILQFFSVSPDSEKGKAIRQTIRKCETNPAEGETKICATSSESMLEFLKNAFGQADFKLISTTHPTMKTPTLQSYTVLEPAREIESPRKVACHPLPYLYAVYMCHYDNTETKTFKVALVGDNGDKVNALIVCHMHTSAWSPKHTAFSFLGTKPGIPVCHTFSEGHVVWVQSSKPVVAI